jgi:hypothetical protein
MRIRPVQPPEPPPPPAPFPVKLYLVGVAADGMTEILRFDLNCSFTDFGQTVHLPDPTLELIQ